MGERGPDKNAIVWILVIVALGLFGISFINPWFYFDDIIYYAIIAIVLVIICSFLNSNGRDVNVNVGRVGPVSIRWGNRCGACGKELPPTFRTGQYCPYCDTYIGISRGIRKFFDFNFWGRTTRPAVADDDETIGKVQLPRYRQAKRVGWFGWLDPPREEATDHQRGSERRPRISKAKGQSVVCPFVPPFDDLFKNQDLAKAKLESRIDWSAVHQALKAWATGILTSKDVQDEAVKKDAFAKWEAWMAFDRAGIADPALLPILYQREMDAVATMVTEQTEAEKKPICPGCGASGDDIVPLSVPATKDARQEFTCKACGQVF